MFHLKNSTILLSTLIFTITDDKVFIKALTAAVVAGVGVMAIIICIVIKKTCKLIYLHHILSVEKSLLLCEISFTNKRKYRHGNYIQIKT